MVCSCGWPRAGQGLEVEGTWSWTSRSGVSGCLCLASGRLFCGPHCLPAMAVMVLDSSYTSCCTGSAPGPPKGSSVTATHRALDLQATLPLLSQEPPLPRGHPCCGVRWT